MASDITVPVAVEPELDYSDLAARLSKKDITSDGAIAAMKGEKISWALGSPLMKYCLIRGIRHHDGFGEEIRSATPAFSRAWNAQRIMNNSIDDMVMSNPEEQTPYCIWYPTVASESTYRELADRYPHMKYQVARACAVAGYTDLYRELEVLPEVHIAEEARDNGHMTIFNDIVSAPVRYAIMNDYTRTNNLDNPRAGAFLNGDTAVRSSLDMKRKMEMPYLEYPFCDGCHPWTVKVNGPVPDDDDDDEDLEHLCMIGYPFKPGYFNITEDASIDTYNGFSPECESRPASLEGPDLISPLLYSPLPQDLPAGNKDILILMAAYNGDIDRYARLRRPGIEIPTKQIACVMRGIYHSTLFAKWWADRLADYPKTYRPRGAEIVDGFALRYIEDIHKAINARYIMVNNLGLITEDTPEWHLPYCIWYPGIPNRRTLKELVRRKPSMRQAAARACIVGGYSDLFDELDPEPDSVLLSEAKGAKNTHFEEFFNKKLERLGEDYVPKSFWNESWKTLTRRELHEPTFGTMAMTVHRKVDDSSVDSSFIFPYMYEEHSVFTGTLELSISGRDLLLAEGQDKLYLEEVYAPDDEGQEEREGHGDGEEQSAGKSEDKSEAKCDNECEGLAVEKGEGQGEGQGERKGEGEAHNEGRGEVHSGTQVSS
ncbi:hypothetical protein V8F20_006013 [Naviculisporaceae sp. PSN 640]